MKTLAVMGNEMLEAAGCVLMYLKEKKDQKYVEAIERLIWKMDERLFSLLCRQIENDYPSLASDVPEAIEPLLLAAQMEQDNGS